MSAYGFAHLRDRRHHPDVLDRPRPVPGPLRRPRPAGLEGGRPGGMVLIEGVGPGYGPAGRAEKLRAETEGSAAPPRTDPPQAGGPWE
ncbi:hypothetical protein [Streptomyces sp. BpilaLS-43]|uniref:hypothetical protein n=1 Tax=Streptomyces sp. BpilaLS-43 TaxID=1839778 RepID=UPI00159F3082|nr:hypothetical protein [Streptomyces sp. BpilaLS-43]